VVIISPGVAMSVSTTTVNVAAAAAALVASTGIFVLGPFSQDAPSHLPPPPMEVVCAEAEWTDPAAPPVLSGCQYQGYPVAVIAPATVPF